MSPRPQLLLRLLATEGPRAVADRLLDRLAEGRRRRAFRTLRKPPSSRSIPVLHLLSTPPAPRLGGVPTQLLRRLEATRGPWSLLCRVGADFRLELADPLEPCALPLGPDLLGAVTVAVRSTGARLLHVENLAGFATDELEALAAIALPRVVAVHDFAGFCPRHHLLEHPHLTYCGESRDLARCARCLAASRPASREEVGSLRRAGGELLAGAAAVVYPSAYLRDRHCDLFSPRLATNRQHVIPPAVPHPSPPPERRDHRDGRLHLAALGSGKTVKGARVLAAALAVLTPSERSRLAVTVYGGGEVEELRRLARLRGVRVRGYYRSGALSALLAAAGCDLSLHLSPVPESYGMAIDESFAAGIPVLAFDHGAPGERLRHTGGALLVAPARGAEGVATCLRELLAGRPLPVAPDLPEDTEPGRVAESWETLHRRIVAAGP